MKIAILGFGTVGSGAYDVARKAGNIEVAKILARHGREGYEDLSGIITPEIEDITSDSEIELVIESIGGLEPARSYVLACLNAGKHVVTPNKLLISRCYGELMKAAADNGVQLRFTSSVGGGIPWLHNLLRTKRCDEICEVRGIVNGTCNYILDAMFNLDAEFGEMLAKAQKNGYAEANPDSDINGPDTLYKAVISANTAFDGILSPDAVPCYGISTVEACDIKWFKAHGYSCKLIMKAKRCGDSSVTAYVEPTLFPLSSLEANVSANNNMMTLTGDKIGEQSFCGQGAGSVPTGESVIQDVIDIMSGEGCGPTASDRVLANNTDIELHRYYIRHDRMCEHISPLIDTYEEKDGIYYCISKPLRVEEMHRTGHHRKEKGKAMFFAALPEE